MNRTQQGRPTLFEIYEMSDAEPRTRAHRRGTQYEVVLYRRTADGNSLDAVRVGFTSRTTRQGLLAVVRSRGDEVIARCGITEEDVTAFRRDAAGRWHLDLSGSWSIGFSGRTERDVRAMLDARVAS
jgi:hypothetical protein